MAATPTSTAMVAVAATIAISVTTTETAYAITTAATATEAATISFGGAHVSPASVLVEIAMLWTARSEIVLVEMSV